MGRAELKKQITGRLALHFAGVATDPELIKKLEDGHH
jgi:hypothetical protein